MGIGVTEISGHTLSQLPVGAFFYLLFISVINDGFDSQAFICYIE